jgi:hypothetical protein
MDMSASAAAAKPARSPVSFGAVRIIERDTIHLVGPSLSADLAELPVVVPALWRRVFEGNEESDTVFAELSEEPGGPVHRITVGVLVAEATGETIEVPGAVGSTPSTAGPRRTSAGRTPRCSATPRRPASR